MPNLTFFANFIYYTRVSWKMIILIHYKITREYKREDAEAVRIDLIASVSSFVSPDDLVSNNFFLVSLLEPSKDDADIVGSDRVPFNLL